MAATFQRRATAALTLSDGTCIPKGTKIEMATCSVHEDESLFVNASEFDGFRSYRKRQEPGAKHKHQYVSTSRTDLSWGYGRHSCPGRFVADIEIKLVLAEMLLNYDMKFADGQERPKSTEFEAVVGLLSLYFSQCCINLRNRYFRTRQLWCYSENSKPEVAVMRFSQIAVLYIGQWRRHTSSQFDNLRWLTVAPTHWKDWCERVHRQTPEIQPVGLVPKVARNLPRDDKATSEPENHSRSRATVLILYHFINKSKSNIQNFPPSCL